MNIGQLRREYHRRICDEIIRTRRDRKTKMEYPNFADGSNKSSREIAWGMSERLSCPANRRSIKAQTIGHLFERATADFLQKAFESLEHVRPGKWVYSVKSAISVFDQYEHLAYLKEVVKKDTNLSSVLGGDYIVKPDIVIGRQPVSDKELAGSKGLLDKNDSLARLTPLRATNRRKPRALMHASISCKWTIRSDRSQNTRTEALNLIRNRKGHLPHIVAVTAEPLPTRIATLALGTGDLDCVYHLALHELQAVIESVDNQDQLDIMMSMIEGRRLRDISDLPFDLAI